MTSITTLEHTTLGNISASDFTLSQLSLLLFEKGLLLGFDNVSKSHCMSWSQFINIGISMA